MKTTKTNATSIDTRINHGNDLIYIPSQYQFTGSAEILSVTECMKHLKIYNQKPVRVTGLLKQVHFVTAVTSSTNQQHGEKQILMCLHLEEVPCLKKPLKSRPPVVDEPQQPSSHITPLVKKSPPQPSNLTKRPPQQPKLAHTPRQPPPPTKKTIHSSAKQAPRILKRKKSSIGIKKGDKSTTIPTSANSTMISTSSSNNNNIQRHDDLQDLQVEEYNQPISASKLLSTAGLQGPAQSTTLNKNKVASKFIRVWTKQRSDVPLDESSLGHLIQVAGLLQEVKQSTNCTLDTTNVVAFISAYSYYPVSASTNMQLMMQTLHERRQGRQKIMMKRNDVFDLNTPQLGCGPPPYRVFKEETKELKKELPQVGYTSPYFT